MRKKLEFASIDKKISLDMAGARTMLDQIYNQRREYVKKIGRDPVGIAIPVRLYMVLHVYKNEFMRVMEVDAERKMTLFGLDIQPTAGSEVSFIPHIADLVHIAILEEFSA